MKIKIISVILIMLITITAVTHLSAQDLNCNITVTSPQTQQSDKTIYQTLQKAIIEFVKNRKWTNYNFKPEERIDCNIMINVTERTSTEDFKATIQVQARRPIYKSSYNSVLFNYIDKDFSLSISNSSL